jgi:HK97 family phage portal protein
MSLLQRVVTRVFGPSVVKQPVQTFEGVLSTGWPSNWWQLGYRPAGNGENGVAEAAIQTNAQGVAVCPPQHRRILPNGTRQLIQNSPFVRLLERPNAYQTRSDLMLNTVRSLLATGNAYWYLADGDERYAGLRVPREIHLLPPHSTRGVFAEDGSVFYGTQLQAWMEGGAFPAMLPARRIAHFKLHTGTDPLLGVSPLAAAAAALSANNAIMAHQAHFHLNMARPSGVLSTDQSLSVDQMRALRAAWKEQSTDLNSGGVPILASGLKWQNMSLSSTDAQMIEAFRMTVEDISRAFRVPLPLLNALQNATLNNAETLINFWLSTGLGFILNHVESAIDRAFDLPVDEKIDFDTNVLLRSDMKGRMEALKAGVIGGIYSPNEARALEGLPPATDGDEPRLQQQVVPLSFYREQAEAAAAAAALAAQDPPAEEDEEDDDTPEGGTEERILDIADRWVRHA